VQSHKCARWTSPCGRTGAAAAFGAVLCFGVCLCVAGCGGPQTGKVEGSRKAAIPPSPFAIDKCSLDVNLQPTSHRLEANAALTISQKDPARAQGAKLQLQLHRDLGIDAITMDGRPIGFRRLPEPAQSQPATDQAATSAPSSAEASDSEKPPANYELEWKPARGQPGTLVVRYGGCLYQDVSAGEKPGKIHNLQMKAHIGEEGVFLSEDGIWYPGLPQPEAKDGREIELTQFELTATEVPGMVLVASGNRDGAELNSRRNARTIWRSPFPLHGLALVGGPHEIHQRQVDAVLVSVHVSKDHAALAPGLLDAVESYLKLYQPLIGKYPYTEFTVVENFFSSGFAFPGFTVLASAVIAMGPMGLEPGYLDHELLHNWWGNGVFVSGLDGNWCESLTSYCANYMRNVLEGRDQKARAVRRDICYGLSRLSPDKDKPLGRFGHDDGPEGFIGYQKGSMVFAMLSQKVGPETLWRALRRLRQERLGKPTNWEQIRQAVERESDQSLEAFFKQWVRGTGIPDIVLDEASYDGRARRLTVTVTQDGRQAFDVAMPIRLVFENRGADEMVSIRRPTQVAVLKSMEAPKYVELDPDFYVMRRIPLKDVLPTISGIGKSKSLLIVRTEDDFDAYKQVAEQMEERYKEADGTAVRYMQAAELKAEDFKQGHVLLLGKACLAAPAQELLKAQTLALGDGFFTVGEKRYDKPTDELLCCLRNEADAGGVFCFYYGNSAQNLKKARVITFYGGNSLVVFEDGKATFRQDFERAEQVIVQTEAH
jgi:aminopeptidase N